MKGKYFIYVPVITSTYLLWLIEYFQYDILEESLNALEKLCKSNLCKMKSLFPQNRPSDGLGNEKS